MRKLSALAILCSIFAIGVFGFLAMHPEGMQKMAGCIAAALAGATCPAGTPLEQSFFHIDAFKALSLATFGDSGWFMLSVAFAAVILAGHFFPSSRPLLSRVKSTLHDFLLSRRDFRAAFFFLPLAFQNILRRFAFFTHSPCLA